MFKTANIFSLILCFFFFYFDFFFFFNPELFVNLIISFFLVYFIYYFNITNQKNILFQKNELKKKNFIFILTVLLQWKKIQIRNKLIKKFYLIVFLKNVFSCVLHYIVTVNAAIEFKIKKLINYFFYFKLLALSNNLKEKETISSLNKSNLLNFWYYNINFY